MKLVLSALVGSIALFAVSCKKIDLSPGHQSNTAQGITYTIKKGSHYCDNNDYTSVELQDLKFVVKFDESAVYQTAVTNNQLDVNKLYGFSDNGAQHHEYSARFGWRWSQNSLRLFAYVYNDGEMKYEEITAINTGQEYTCNISVAQGKYVFTVNDKTVIMPRTSATVKADGYRLYPYFGGDETAPHDIRIWIRELPGTN